ncbi:RNA-directed DNA polymerase, eukaryota, reverse transcriptase zinc-binding domain protein [Tanacetum coccineum]
MGRLPRSSPWKGVLGKGTLSPFSFFLIVVEALRQLYKRVIEYADDALFFGKWSDLSAKHLIHILKCYEDASGLKVNLAKSRLFGIEVPQNEVDLVASTINCSSDNTPFMYLGLPVGRNMHYSDGWSEVVDRFRTRLSSWKANCLSIGVRLMLVINGVWGDIVKAVKTIELSDPVFKPSFLKKFSNGSNTLFWMDTWCKDGSILKDKFPCTWSWSVPSRGRTLDDLSNLISLIGNVSLFGDADDKWVWTLHPLGALNVKALSNMIQDKVLIDCVGRF